MRSEWRSVSKLVFGPKCAEVSQSIIPTSSCAMLCTASPPNKGSSWESGCAAYSNRVGPASAVAYGPPFCLLLAPGDGPPGWPRVPLCWKARGGAVWQPFVGPPSLLCERPCAACLSGARPGGGVNCSSSPGAPGSWSARLPVPGGQASRPGGASRAPGRVSRALLLLLLLAGINNPPAGEARTDTRQQRPPPAPQSHPPASATACRRHRCRSPGGGGGGAAAFGKDVVVPRQEEHPADHGEREALSGRRGARPALPFLAPLGLLPKAGVGTARPGASEQPRGE